MKGTINGNWLFKGWASEEKKKAGNRCSKSKYSRVSEGRAAT